MKILTIGDVHGLSNWKIPTFGSELDFMFWKNVQLANGIAEHVADMYPFSSYDFVVFVGDYVDSFILSNAEIISNLHDIILFKRSYPERVLCLIGNHDVQYIYDTQRTHCGGIRAEMIPVLEKIFKDNENLFKAAFSPKENWLWTHAGVTGTYKRLCVDTMDHNSYRFKDIVKDMSLCERLNFMWETRDASLFLVSASSKGSSEFPSPLWSRPEELDTDPINVNQVVGHTKVPDIIESKVGDVRHIYVDALPMNKWSILEI